MFNRAPSLGRLTLALLCLAVVGGLFLVGRCRHLAPAAPRPSEVLKAEHLAHLSLINSSDCEWQIVATSTLSGDRRTWRISVAQTIDAELAGGDYAVEQTLLADGAGPDATRRFTMQLQGGQSYRWRLMTLLSDESGGSRTLEKTQARHE